MVVSRELLAADGAIPVLGLAVPIVGPLLFAEAKSVDDAFVAEEVPWKEGGDVSVVLVSIWM